MAIVGISQKKTFRSEISALTEARHRNIVKLHGFCSTSEHTFLVYEYLEVGSVGSLLGGHETAARFGWLERRNVVRGVAEALSYLHHDRFPPIIHRDISSKNILLDKDYEAHVSDFGTARFIKQNSSNWTSFAGTFGYAAPGTILPCYSEPHPLQIQNFFFEVHVYFLMLQSLHTPWR